MASWINRGTAGATGLEMPSPSASTCDSVKCHGLVKDMPSHDVKCRYTLVTLVNAVAVERQTGASEVLQDQSSQLRIPWAPPRSSISLQGKRKKGCHKAGAARSCGAARNSFEPAGCLGSLAKCLSCNQLHILRSAQKPLSLTHQHAVTARTAGENGSRFYARRGNPSVPKIGRPNKVWPPSACSTAVFHAMGSQQHSGTTTTATARPPCNLFLFCTWPATAWLHNEQIKLDGAL